MWNRCRSVFFAIRRCMASEQSQPVLVGEDKCTWVPSYWCANAVNAQECGIDAEVCSSQYGAAWASEQSQPVLVGEDKCTWGPSYWCANAVNAQECGIDAEV